MTQEIKKIDAEEAVQVIVDWLEHDPEYNWDKSPVWVITKIIYESDDETGLISYHDAVKILGDASCPKMGIRGGSAGMDYFKSKWKLMYKE